MKSIPAALATHIASGSTTLATALKITRLDAAIYGFTTADSVPGDTISGVLYKSDPGLRLTDIVVAASAAVGNLELVTLHDESTFETPDITGGKWKNSAFLIFRYNWANISNGTYPLLSGTLGEVEIMENTLKVELRDLRQYLQQPVGRLSQKTCPYRLGDEFCSKDITVPPYTVTGTITNVTSTQVIRDSARTEAADFFGEGLFRWDSGNNAGLMQKVKSYDANGTFTLALPAFRATEVGDDYTAVVGCRKRREEDCIAKFSIDEPSHFLNFGGEPDRKGLNDIIKPAGA